MNESHQNQAPALYDDEMDLRELFRVLWAGKWLICGITGVAAVAAIIVALMLPNIYRAEALLAPNSQDGGGGLSALAAQYGGLASLAGINLQANANDRTALGLEVLRSRQFISEFIERHNILVPLMASTGWDWESEQLQIDSKAYDVKSGEWIRDVSSPRNPVPSSQEAYKAFRNILFVSQDRKTGFVRVAIEHYSPQIAKRWVDWLVLDLNSSIMRRDVSTAEQSIAYLNEQIVRTSVTALQELFYRLIEEQTKTMMLASVSKEYLLKTIDPAIVPERKSKPNRSLLVIFVTMLGGILGVAVVTILNRRKV